MNMNINMIRIICIGVISIILLGASFYTIDNGHVGIIFRGGALLDDLHSPGFIFHNPIDYVYQIQTTMQTDKVTNVPCGTKGGVVLYFDSIEVVNKLDKSAVYFTVKEYNVNYDKALIFDKVHHELNQFCSSHTLEEVYITKFDQIDEYIKTTLQSSISKLAPGLEIMSVRVTKPRIPEEIQKSYEDMENQKTQLLLAQEHQKVIEKKAETDKKKAIIDAEKEAAIQKIKIDALVLEKERMREISKIEDITRSAREKSITDSEYYKHTRESRAYREMLTPEYLEFKRNEALSYNTKIFFGPDIPTYFRSMIPDSMDTLQNNTHTCGNYQ